MSLSLLGLGAALPGHVYTQPALCELAIPCMAQDARQRRLLPSLYHRTGVRHRQSVIDIGAFYPPPLPGDDTARGPSTAQRMQQYVQHVVPLASEAVRGALTDAGAVPGAIAQLVAVSCTGFASPGLDLGLMQACRLPPTAGRTQLGFMGCHGALNGLRTAHALAVAQPGRPVVLCCAELCTLHFQYGWDTKQIVSNALFADGAAACVAVCDPGRDGEEDGPMLVDSTSAVLPDSADAMTWTIGDHGFRMGLSAAVPGLIREHLEGFVGPWLASHGLSTHDVGGWAIHPGGPRVISEVERALKLNEDAGAHSRAVLAEHGNMSSPTVLFILDRLRSAGVDRPWVALAFGPGLTVEAALFR